MTDIDLSDDDSPHEFDVGDEVIFHDPFGRIETGEITGIRERKTHQTIVVIDVGLPIKYAKRLNEIEHK